MAKLPKKTVFADAGIYSVRPSNSSNPPLPEDLEFDKDAPEYDMSGDKFLIILNQYQFEDTPHFKYGRPNERNGTQNDERRLKEEFYKLGFLIFVFRDFKYHNIINYLTAIASLDHSKTSCICVTILTHGDKGDEVYAADMPYRLSEVIGIFERQTSLTNKPKLFFVQACRGDNMDPGHCVRLSRPRFRSRTWTTRCSPRMQTDTRHTDDLNLSASFSCLRVLGLFCMRANHTDAGPSRNYSLLTVPTHADTLVLRSTVEDHLSYRDEDGSWMIQSLCDIIRDYHMERHLLDMIVLMNREVAYEKITRYCRIKQMENKKQMPETRFTLTKNLWLNFYIREQYLASEPL